VFLYAIGAGSTVCQMRGEVIEHNRDWISGGYPQQSLPLFTIDLAYAYSFCHQDSLT
jgi:hypothetical protein